MNRKQRRIAQSQEKIKPEIALGSRSCTAQQANMLAIKAHSVGNLQAAAEIYRLILAQAPGDADTYNNQGVILHELKRYGEALASCDKALKLNSNYATCHYNRANTLHALRRLDEALASYDKSIALKPDVAEAHNNRGNTLQALGRFSEALASYDKALRLRPDFAEAHGNRGSVLQELRRYDEALASCDRAIALQADYAQAHYNRAVTLQELKRYEEVLDGYDKTIAFRPDYAEAHNNRGITLRELKRYDEAIVSCDKAIALRPDYADPYQNKGIALVDKGDMAGAEKMFREALELKPDFANPWFSLTNIRKYRDVNHPDIKAIRQALDRRGEGRGSDYLYFALGKIYDDCGLYDQAFECYRRANDMLGREVKYDPAGVSKTTDAIMEVFSKDFLAREFPFSSECRAPVFIVGMPRSGTTLMASMLSNHGLVATAGELTTIAQFTLGVPEFAPYPQAARQIAPELAGRMIHAYEQRLRRDAGAEVPYVIDKYPFNVWHLGLIAMLFPGARIIHCTRHPLDIVISNYFRRFGLDYDYSFDLRHIAHCYGEYARLAQHWRQALPMEMIEVAYEDMIADTEQTARRALDFLGLDWDERCLTPHTNKAPVETASNWQVRQPIYKQSVERWRHYEKYLGPVKEMLGISD